LFKTLYDAPIFLRSEELETVRLAEIPENLRESRDAFVLQCALGCRVSDFKELSMSNVSVNDEGIPYIHYLPNKTKNSQDTNTEIETPLVRYAFDIVKRTGLDFSCTKHIYGQTGYNADIRSVLRLAGINRKVSVFNEETKSNEYKPLYEEGSSKLARKTHVDMMNKVQINRYAAGLHRNGSNAIERYTKLEMKDRFILMNAAFDQKDFRVDSNLNLIETKRA